MVDNKTLIVHNSDIINLSAVILNDFHQKWINTFKDISINVDKFNHNIENDYVQIYLSGTHLESGKKIHINVSALKKSPFYEDLTYEILAFVPQEIVKSFNTEDFDFHNLRENFYLMANSLGGFNCDNKGRLDSTFSFDKQGALRNIKVLFRNHTSDRNTDENYGHMSDHYIYNVDDISFLKKHKLDESIYQKHVRNFYFLWDHTALKEHLFSDDFWASFKLYSTDVDRYHSLLKMEII